VTSGSWSVPDTAHGRRRTGKRLATGVAFRDADLSHADLSETDIGGRDLSEADLTGTNLAGADTDDAVLPGDR